MLRVTAIRVLYKLDHSQQQGNCVKSEIRILILRILNTQQDPTAVTHSTSTGATPASPVGAHVGILAVGTTAAAAEGDWCKTVQQYGLAQGPEAEA